jgi:GABA(A) receptor-associated protein
MYTERFFDKYSFLERLEESQKIMNKFPERFPVICEKNGRDNSTPDIDKHKYLVPYNITLGQFIHIIRKRLQLQPSSSLFLFIGKEHTILPNNTIIDDIYHLYKNNDGFLYVMYSRESVFG